VQFRVFSVGYVRATTIELEDFTPLEDTNVKEVKEFEKVLNENMDLLKKAYKKEFKPLIYGRNKEAIVAIFFIKDYQDNSYYLWLKDIDTFTRNILWLKEEYGNKH
jgi:hypothetical protein